MESQISRIVKVKPHKNSKENFSVESKSSKGVVVCPKCHNAYFKKQWHHPISPVVKQIKPSEPVSFVTCPACFMVNNNNFAGEIVIDNIPKNREVELVNLITNYNLKIQKRDPQHRVIHITKDEDKNSYRVTTTENQMAVGLGKKIKSSFDKMAEMTVSFSKEPFAMVLVNLVFHSK